MKKGLRFFLPVLIGVTLLSVPLLRDLHFESALLAGSIGSFWAGLQSSSKKSQQDLSLSLEILGFLYLASVPLFIFSLLSGCLTFDGIAFWVLIPVPSVFLGTAIGRYVRKQNLPYAGILVFLTLLFISVGVLLIEFLLLPQVYFYNHIWGLWPGPIYDEAVYVTGSFLFFRFITLLWILLLWVLPHWNKSLKNKLVSGLIFILLSISYSNLHNVGIISPTGTIQQNLGGKYQTRHFNIYYDISSYTRSEIQYWATRHEFHFQQILSQLDINWPPNRKIHSYLYAHAWQKKEITGAKFTSYVPIWLSQDQLHIAKQQLDPVLKHEMVHVISKQFGNTFFNGSWSIGLIEGLAEAIARDASSQSTLHQIVAAERPLPSADNMKSALSITGFYGTAGAISYTTAGSFVQYLLHNYPFDHFKQAYKTANIENTYPVSIDELVSGWHQTLKETELDSVDKQVSEFIFAQRSLFQKECPHSISNELKLWDEYNYLMASRDTSSAYRVLTDLYQTDSHNALVKAEWIRSKLNMGEPDTVIKSQIVSNSILNLNVLYADALFMSQGFEEASLYLGKFREDISSQPARNFRYTLDLRMDSVQWAFFLNQRYSDHLVKEDTFLLLNTPNKLLTLNKALDLKYYDNALIYLRLLSVEALSQDWFDIIEKAIHMTAYSGEYDMANELINTYNDPDLRARYNERLSEQSEWLSFLQDRNYIDQ